MNSLYGMIKESLEWFRFFSDKIFIFIFVNLYTGGKSPLWFPLALVEIEIHLDVK